MGKRSRKRIVSDPHAIGQTSQRESDVEAPRPRASASRPRPLRSSAAERPPAPWGSFPLVELLVLLSLGLLVAGFLMQRIVMVVVGLGIGSVAGLELSIREHFAGFRSHTTLLAAATAFPALALTYFVAGSSERFLMLPIGGAIFLAAFWVLRRSFRSRSGGVGFRR
ncbi:MAG: hypothetical protein NVSMB25_20520 [Thermoleophilaceae bacterium]